MAESFQSLKTSEEIAKNAPQPDIFTSPVLYFKSQRLKHKYIQFSIINHKIIHISGAETVSFSAICLKIPGFRCS